MNKRETLTRYSLFYRLFLLITFISLLFVLSCKEAKKPGEETPASTGTTVAASDSFIARLATIRNTDKGREVLFTNKQAIYTIAEKDIRLFTDNYRNGEPLKVIADSLNNILSIKPLTATEAASAKLIFNDSIRGGSPALFDGTKIDSLVFNRQLGNPDFKKWNAVSCTSVIPNIAAAQSLFDFCAAQGCTAPNPTVNPCIPFQYVIDGCYARAHKMRWIIETMYKYCDYKVFSFANQGNDVLAVKASKWGGCCVQWWYHVAPLVYVNINGIATAYVIDPGMFNTPVTLSTWLLAQQTTSCNARAKVSMYTIQPSSAYTPANYQGTAFTTDPSYVQTDQTLIAYKNKITCP